MKQLEAMTFYSNSAIIDGLMTGEDVAAVLTASAALKRLGVDPLELLMQGKGAQGPDEIANEVELLSEAWELKMTSWRLEDEGAFDGLDVSREEIEGLITEAMKAALRDVYPQKVS